MLQLATAKADAARQVEGLERALQEMHEKLASREEQASETRALETVVFV